MKNVFKLTVLFVAVFAFAVSCGSSKAQQTVENLKAAITGETNASAKYQAFSVKAAEEGYPSIASMFAAASAAEAIHVKNHNAVLVKMEEEAFNPIPDTPTVNATANNMQVAIEGEIYEFTVMYPGFIAVAETEQNDDAIGSFALASDAEAVHAERYSQSLEILKTTGSDEDVASVWYVCPKCGDLFNTIEGVNRCPLCGVSSSSFLKF